MKENVLVLIKPDGISKGLTGYIINKLEGAKLDLIACQMVRFTRERVAEHYKHIKNQPFFEDVVQFSLGAFHPKKYVMAMIFRGENAIKKCRNIAGATNPEEADLTSVRGSCGRITTKGVYENVLHVSSDNKEAKREIMLWFQPEEIVEDIFPTKKMKKTNLKKVWA